MRSVSEVETGAFHFSNHFFQFEGTTVGGKPCGAGTLVLGDGTVLSGHFDHGDLNGEGTKRWSNGSLYSGTFVKGEFHGRGRWLDVHAGLDYVGSHCMGTKEGEGRQVDMRRREVYEGTFVKGKPCGTGVLIRFPPGVFFDVEARPTEILAAVQQRQAEADAAEGAAKIPQGCSMVQATMIRLGIKSVAASEGPQQGPLVPSTGGGSPSTGPAGLDQLQHGYPFHVIRGEFVRGVPHGSKVEATFANGDLYDGSAVDGLWCGEGPCDFFALSGCIRYVGPMEKGLRAEIPSAVILQDIFHDSCGSMLQQLHSGDGFLRVTTSCLISLQQVRKTREMVRVVKDEEVKGNKSKGANRGTAAAASGKGHAKTADHTAHAEPEYEERDVIKPCLCESGRAVRATIYKLNSSWTDAQRAAKRIPRDATRTLFATEPLTPRKDLGSGSHQTSPMSPSAKTPGSVLDGSAAPSPSGRMSAETPALSSTGSKLGKLALSRSRSKGGGSGSGSMHAFTLDQGRPMLHFHMTNGAVTVKIAPLARESGDYIVKLEVNVGEGVQLTPGDAQQRSPLEGSMFLIPMHVIR